MASWIVVDEQTVSISARATFFTVICEQCLRLGVMYPSVEGRLPLDALHGTIECTRGHRLRVERDNR